MKCRIVKIKIPIIFSGIVAIVFFVFLFNICIDQIDKDNFETKEFTTKVSANQFINTEKNEIKIIDNEENNLKEYENFPEQYRECKTVGKITIPKLNIEKYVLEETNEKTLKLSVTKTCGPKVNEVGNFCISGHNYNQTFGRIKELEIGDKIIVTDTYGREVVYQVYRNYKVDPNDTTCLDNNTNGEREITLITCTLGAIKRTIIKAIEVYD